MEAGPSPPPHREPIRRSIRPLDRALEAKHLADLTFPEVSRALRALSSTYVERRQKLAEGAALSGAGKRAAFALFYGPLHYLLVAHIVQQLPAATANVATLVDLGCGTGASGAAWAGACDEAAARARHRSSSVGDRRSGRDLSRVHDSRRPFVRATSRASRCRKGPVSILAAFTMNELPDAERDALLDAAGRARRPTAIAC